MSYAPRTGAVGTAPIGAASVGAWTAAPSSTTPLRVSQQPVEVLASGDPALRVSQQPVEVLASGDPALRVSQQVVEVVIPNPDYARLTQQGVETVSSYTPTARLTQQGVETVSAYTPTARLTQQGVETASAYTPTARMTQIGVEVLRSSVNSYEYWRLELASPGYCAIREIEMRSSRGGADQCNGGTPTASSVWASQTAALAFDNSTSTYWESGVAGGSHWIQYRFPGRVEINEIVITQGYTVNKRVQSFVVKASNDGSSWVTIHTGFNCDFFADFQVERYWLSGTKTYWRLNITANQVSTGTTYLQFSEMDMRLSIGGADQCSGGNVNSSSFFNTEWEPTRVFDNNNSTDWSSANAALPSWIRYHFDDNKNIVEYFVRSSSTGNLSYTPKAWTLEYSGDGINWTVAATILSETGWSSGETRVFSTIAYVYNPQEGENLFLQSVFPGSGGSPPEAWEQEGTGSFLTLAQDATHPFGTFGVISITKDSD